MTSELYIDKGPLHVKLPCLFLFCANENPAGAAREKQCQRGHPAGRRGPLVRPLEDDFRTGGRLQIKADLHAAGLEG